MDAYGTVFALKDVENRTVWGPRAGIILLLLITTFIIVTIAITVTIASVVTTTTINIFDI